MKAAVERHPAMLRQDHTAGCLPCENVTTTSPQIRWTHDDTGAPSPNRRRQPTQQRTPPLSGMPTAPTGITSEAQRSQIDNFPAGYVYSHTSHTCAEFLKVDAYAQDSQYDADFNPDMLTDEGISTGQYAICQVVMQLTSILKMRAAY